MVAGVDHSSAADLQGHVEAGETHVPQVPSQPLVPGRLSIKSRFEVGVIV